MRLYFSTEDLHCDSIETNRKAMVHQPEHGNLRRPPEDFHAGLSRRRSSFAAIDKCSFAPSRPQSRPLSAAEDDFSEACFYAQNPLPRGCCGVAPRSAWSLEMTHFSRRRAFVHEALINPVFMPDDSRLGVLHAVRGWGTFADNGS